MEVEKARLLGASENIDPAHQSDRSVGNRPGPIQAILIRPMPVSKTVTPLAAVRTWFQNCHGSE